MTAAARTIAPGFPDPVLDSQRVFRALLTAMSYPGRIVEIDASVAPPAPLGPAAAAVCLALVDYETPLWAGDSCGEAARGWLRFHCGCAIAEAPRAARFALLPFAEDLPDLAAFDIGEDEYPDRSATLILEVADFDSGPPVTLTGPGIKHSTILRAAGLPPGFWPQWQANHALFPLGVDLILTCGSRVAGLPRTVRAEA